MNSQFLGKIKCLLGTIVIAIPFMFSCSEKELSEKRIDFSFEKRSESTIREIISKYSIIKLETTGDSKINIIRKVMIQNGKVYVLNHQENKQEILVFSMEGRYHNKISENAVDGVYFSNIVDFDINPINRNVTILDQKQRQLVTFGEDTKFIERYQINTPAKEIALGDRDGNFFSVLYTESLGENSISGYEISTYDENYRLLKNYFPLSNSGSSFKSNERTLGKRNGSVMFLRIGTNNLYGIDLKKCRNISDFIFPKPVLSADKMYDAFFGGNVNRANYVYNIDYQESDSLIYTTFSSVDGNYIGVYNKESGISKLFNILLDPSCKCGIKIDIVGSFENSFIVQIPRIKIPDILKVLDSERKKCSNDEMFKIIDNMEPGENPILLLLKFNL